MKKIEKVQKQLKSKDFQIIEQQNEQFTKDLSLELNTNPEFSLIVDPLSKYNMQDKQKEFVKYYCDYKSIPVAAELADIDMHTAKLYFTAYASQQEIRRINRAMYQRQFSNKLLSIDNIMSWLSSLITDENVPTGDRIKTMDKVRVAQVLIDMQKYKNEAINDPNVILHTDIETDIKSLSVKSIKMLISQRNKQITQNDNDNLIEEIKDDKTLMPEEEAFLKTLSHKELLDLIETTAKGGEN